MTSIDSGFAVVIPARYASERLPGKPLRDINGQPMLQHVWQRGLESGAQQVVVATDDDRIAGAAEKFGATVCMTSSGHESGTDRIAEVVDVLDWPDDKIVVNLQGDEPLMPPELINCCAALLEDPSAHLATLASPIADKATLADPNVVKVITDASGYAIYFSRAAIPYSRSADTDELAVRSSLHHHGIYAYRSAVLRQLVSASPTGIERCERLEQLRALSLGLNIKVGVPPIPPDPGVDTVDDLDRVQKILASRD